MWNEHKRYLKIATIPTAILLTCLGGYVDSPIDSALEKLCYLASHTVLALMSVFLIAI